MPALDLTAFVLSALRDLFMIVFLVLGSVWFARDLSRRDRKDGQSAPVAAALPAAPVAPEVAAPAAPAAPLSFVPAAAPAAPVSGTPAVHVPGIPHEHLAVITATVHHVFRGRARLAGITRSHVHDSRWAHEGRRDIFTSHRIR